jgi:phage tail tape-measure protein
MMNVKNTVFAILFVFSVFHYSYAEQNSSSPSAGAILGSAAGSLLGYQFGGGRGKYVTTAIGAVSGYIIGGNIQQRWNTEPSYQEEYSVDNTGKVMFIGNDDYLIKQQLSHDSKRRNMIRNGEADPLEMPYNVSDVQTSWDDPNN